VDGPFDRQVQALLAGMSSMEEVIRESGQFGEQQPLPPARPTRSGSSPSSAATPAGPHPRGP